MGGWRLRSAVAVVALGVVLALVLSAAGAGGSAKAFGAGTTLTIISGDVSVRHGTSAFVAASDGEVLSAGDAIRTSPEGRAILTYFEGSTVTIEPATELAIDAANTSADGGTVVLMTQTVGRTWHVVTKLITGGSKYEVRTPASTASVRGTEFQVDTDDATTTVTTTEGTVLARVLGSAQGAATDVPVSAGTTQTQPRNAPPALARTAPEPERKVTVTVDATNTLVVDPLGRANGVSKDGKVVVQTPGAQVKRDGDKIVVTLPNLPDGKLAAQVEKKDAADDHDVDVVTKVEEKGHTTVIDDKAVAKTDQDKKSAGVELKRSVDGTTEGRTLDDSEKQTLPAGKTASPQLAPHSASTPAPTPTLRATEPMQGTATAAPAVTRTPESTRTPDATQRSERTPSATDATHPQADARTAAPRTSEPTARPAATPRADTNTLPPTSKGDPVRTDTAAATTTTTATTTAATAAATAPATTTPGTTATAAARTTFATTTSAAATGATTPTATTSAATVAALTTSDATAPAATTTAGVPTATSELTTTITPSKRATAAAAATTSAATATAAAETTTAQTVTTAPTVTTATTDSGSHASSTGGAPENTGRSDLSARAGDAPSHASDVTPKDSTPRPSPNAPPQPVARSDPAPRADERKPVDAKPERPKAEKPDPRPARGR